MNKNEERITETITNLKACAETIIRHAESIVGTEPFVKGLMVTIHLNPGEDPTINVDKDFSPEFYTKSVDDDYRVVFPEAKDKLGFDLDKYKENKSL
jgi:hypothetical protein